MTIKKNSQRNVNFQLKALGLNCVRSFNTGYIRGSLYLGGHETKKKRGFKTSYIAALIQILFEFTRFFKLQNSIKIEFISKHARGGGELIPERLITGCFFLCLQVNNNWCWGGGGISGSLRYNINRTKNK